MKALNYILIAILLIGGVFVFWKFKKTKKQESEKQDQENKKENKPHSTGSPQVKQLQFRLNSLLPSGYPRLVVDGIYGPLTDAAAKYVAEMKAKGNLPPKKNTTNELGVNVSINTDMVLRNAKDLANFIVEKTPVRFTGLGMLASLF